jgi:carboxyl-terminal processing protease
MRTRALVVLGALSAAIVSGGWLLQHGLASQQAQVDGVRLFDAVAAHVKRFYVDTLTDAEVLEKATTGMLQELHDPHSVYLVPERLRRVTETTSGNYAGIGVQIDVRDRWPTVIGTIGGTPAERAGLRAGDRVVEIDRRATRGWTFDETVKAVRGAPGTTVHLTVERPGVPQKIELDVVRGEIHRRAVGRVGMVRNAIGYVDLNVFSDSTGIELRRAIDSLSGAGMRSLILDLRANPGGLLTQGVEVSDLFLDPNLLIVSMRGRLRETNSQFFSRNPQRWPRLPLVVLVDEGSASASEIVAGALQDHDRALVVGRETYGKGSAQSLFPVEGGGALKLTIARWYTPSGRSIDRAHDGTADVEDEEDGDAKRETYRTAGGRQVFGGGGITPDVLAGDTALAPAEQALQTALGTRVPEFRDAMTAFAISLRKAGTIDAPDFEVTPAMRDEFWNVLRQRRFDFDRSIYDGASALVSRLLGREIARFVFGPAAEAERAIREDQVIQSAARLLDGVKATDELLKRAER